MFAVQNEYCITECQIQQTVLNMDAILFLNQSINHFIKIIYLTRTPQKNPKNHEYMNMIVNFIL